MTPNDRSLRPGWRAPFIERAPPKVNLTLRICGRRPDGYHELDSLVAFAIDLGDVLTLTPGEPNRVTTTGRFAPTISGANLVAVTLDKLAGADAALGMGHVALEKNLPVAAGIGGGSADAAATIRAVMRANPTTALDAHAIALSLGADVPVCLASCAQRMGGLGEILTPVAALPELAIVLANPQAPVPADKTAQVFRRLAAAPLLTSSANTSPIAFVDRRALLAHMRAVGNDLLAPARAIVPQVDPVLQALASQPGCELAQLSGGGPTCFGVFLDVPTAQAAAAVLAADHPTWWVRASRLA